MDILIHGTKGGRRTFTQKKLPGLLDVTADSAKATAVGQQVYAMRFTDDSIILSKYKIIRDVRGDKRTGFIGFSLFLPHNKKLTGVDTITLLDRVSEEYCREYVVENNLNEVIENWDFVYAISKEYENKLKPNNEKMQSGAIDDAFIYFKDADELERYFNILYQEEYSKYRQVLFVEEELRNKPENPLNALRHDLHADADLTGKIDLDNPKYRLIIAQSKEGVESRVKVNGIIRVNGNIIRKKDLIEISYSRSYYKTQEYKVKLDESCPDFVSVDDLNETVMIRGISLDPEIKPIQISAIDSLSEKPIPNIQINCSQVNTGTNKDVNNNQIIFKGDEIGEEWKIKVISTTEEYETIELFFYPEQSNESEFVTLKKRIFLFIEVLNKKSNQLISKNDYKIKIQDKEWTKPQIYDVNEKYKIVFIGKEIEREWNIDIISSKYKVSGEKITIIPKNVEDPSNTIKIHVEEKLQTSEHENHNETDCNSQRNYYSITAGKNGKMIDGFKTVFEAYSVEMDKDAKKRAKTVTKPKLGYKFDRVIIIHSNENGYVYEAQFKSIIPLYLSSIVAMSLIVVTIVFLLNRLISNNPKDIYNKNEILTYVNGDSLFLDNLEKYKVYWKNQEPNEKYNFNPLTWGNGGETVNDTSKVYKEWEVILNSINCAKKKRELMNELDFESLKKMDYSSQQETFKNAIDKIVSGYKKPQLENVSEMTLTNIAKKIDSFTEVNKENIRILAYSNGIELKLDILEQFKKDTIDQEIKQRIESCIALRRALNNGKTSILDTLNFQYSEEQQNLKKALTMINDENRTNVDSAMVKCTISKINLNEIAEFIEITLYLQGRGITKKGLEEYLKQTTNPELKTSINLALKFWTLDGARNKTYYSYKTVLQEDKILKFSYMKFEVENANNSTKYIVKIENENVNETKFDEIIKILKE